MTDFLTLTLKIFDVKLSTIASRYTSITSSYFIYRPHSTDSFTHRKMTMSLADRSTKTQKVKVVPVLGHDPEQNRTEKIKVRFDLIILYTREWERLRVREREREREGDRQRQTDRHREREI